MNALREDELRARVCAQAHEPALALDLVRHGESVANARGRFSGSSEVPLTATGRRQAVSAARGLAARYAIAYSSPLRRSVETLDLALAPASMRAGARVVDARLSERGLGALEGRPRTPLAAQRDGDLGWAPPGGESYLELARRVLAFLLDVRVATVGETPPRVLVCSHLGPLRVIGAVVRGTADARAVMGAGVGHAEVLRLELGRVPWPAFLPADASGRTRMW
jgi:broad specificity phosphatase PhoE